MRLLLLTPGEVTRDPRARRAAELAREHGIEVVAACGRAGGGEPVPLEDVAVKRVGSPGRPSVPHELGLPRTEFAALSELRGLYRLARLVVRTIRLVRTAGALGRVDIVHANDLETLPAGWLLARRQRARLVYDAHELYSAFEPSPPRVERAVALALERRLASAAAAVVTVSDPLAQELARVLRLPRVPLVVLNAPRRAGRDPEPRTGGPLRAVYQGAFGPGRPLGDLLDAVEAVQDVRLAVRVVRMPLDAIEREVARRALADRVDVLDPVPPGRLVEALAAYDVGVIFDRPSTRNAELSLPNKLFDYLMGGLAVVAPRLPGLAPLVEEEGVGVLFDSGDLAGALAELAADRARLGELRARARRAAYERLNAEAQAPALLAAWGRS